MNTIKKKLAYLLIGSWFISQLISFIPFFDVEATTVSLTSRLDFDNGYHNKTEADSKEGELKLTTDGSWGAKAWKTPNLALGDQAAIASDGSYVYLLHNADNHFVRYLPDENRWQTLANAPHYAYYGSDLVILGNYIYAIYGGYQKEFSRYSISANSWEDLTDMPELIWYGSAISTDGTYIYVLRGSSTQDFWRYDPGANSWSTMTNTPSTIYTGGGMVYYSGNLYATRGNNSTTLYRYNIAGNQWYTTTTGGASLTAAPATFNEDRKIDIKGDEIFVVRSTNTNSFYKYDIGDNAWTTLVNTPQINRYVGSVYNSADDMVYVFRGNGTYDFWKYDPDTNLFLGPTDLPATPGSGADLIYYNGYLYLARGNNTQNIYRYSLAGDSWETLTSNSNWTLNDDTKGVQAGGLLYFYRGSNTANFAYYDPAGNSWTTRSDTPSNVRYGGSLAYTGSGDFIYGTRGVETATFWRYSISGDSWSDAAVADLPDDTEPSYGSRLISDGTNIYLIPGYGRSKFLKYTVASDSWSVLSDLPFNPYWGTDIAYYNNKFYAQAGYYKNEFWEYNIGTNTWRRLPNIQTNYAYDAGPYNGGSLEADANGNIYSISGQNITQMYIYAIGSHNYQASGVWTSGVQDLTYVESWGAFSSSVSTPGDSTVSFETRSSSDAISWSDWQVVSGETISSPANRYLQIKATLTASTDRSQTPILYSASFIYQGDSVAPTNPTSFTASSQAVGGASLVSGTSYTYHQPYFTWSGASDSQTAIAGYYVYFGSSSSADPVELGSFQTGTTYTGITELTNGNYYLRIKTKDSAGNTSEATTGFNYLYGSVSPPQSLVRTTTADFSGETDNTNIDSNEIKLANKSGFWLEERLSNAPAVMYNGAALAYVASSSKLYTFRGNGGLNFYEYDIATDTWTAKADSPTAINYGGGVIEGPSGYLFALTGANTSTFLRYDIAANTWSNEAATDMPYRATTGTSMFYDGSRYIYVLRAGSDDAFLRYDALSDLWESLANIDFGAPTYQPNNLVSYGGDLAFDDSNTIYAIQGNTRSGFASYDLNSQSWTRLKNLPALAYYGAQIEYDSTSNAIYYLPGWDKPFFYKYDISSQTWSALTDAPASIGYGASIRNINGVLHILRGANTNVFYKYNIAKASWLIPTMGLFGGLFRGGDYRTFNYGADIIKGDGNYFYLTRGNGDNLFVRYDSVSGSSVKMANAPAGFYYGAELVYDSANNKIYATANVYNRKLFVYDITTDSWTEEASDPPPYDVNTGSAMIYDSSRYIYWLRGGGTQTFYRFDTQGSTGTKWGSALANTPSTMSYGADLVYKGGYIYALRGNNQLGFYRYDPNTNQWNDAAVADLPSGGTIYNDGFLVDGGGDYLYACRGGNATGCYRYSISGDSWETVASAPANIYTGGAGASNGTNKILTIAGPGTNTISDGLYSYIMETSTSSFEESGTYTSAVEDFTAVYRFANIKVTYASATNAGLTVSARSSADNVTWSSWADASELKQVGSSYIYKINSQANRYLQVKFTLTSSDGINSGIISDYTINYYQDTTEPVNPSNLSAYSDSEKTTALTTGNWYNYSSAYFDWPDAEAESGATDTSTGSGIAGYYVYLGANSEADPEELGSYTANSNYTASGLTSGQTYYLRIKTKDNAGNISSVSWQPFVYKFDSSAPTNPTTITVDPPGYTSSDSYTISWSGAEDDGSQISQYCYKTGATGAEETCTAETSISGITKYKTGTNTFYLRVKDNAGNYSSSYATASYYYSSTAPGAPENIRVTYPVGSATNSVNEFAFAWDTPSFYYGQQTALRYYYWINQIPSVGSQENETGLAVSYLSKGSYATDTGTNTLYVVAQDEAGNIDYENYASINFTSSTSAPGAAQNLDISDVSIKETSSWRLALSWDQPVASGSGIAEYRIYRSAVTDADCNTSFSDFTYVANTTQTSYVDTGLTQSSKYYCIKACNYTNGRGCGAVSDTVDLYPDGKWRVAATLIASPSATVKTKSATVSWSTNRTANSFVKYGKSSGSYGEEVGSSDQLTAHTISLTGLDPGTTYYYKALWTDEDGNVGQSDELSLTTNPAPFVSSVKMSNVSIYSAYVVFTVKNAIKVNIKYGKTVNYGSIESISTSTSESTYTVLLNNLTEGSLYHLQIDAEDEEANLFSSDDYTFQTLPVPKIVNFKVQQVAGMPTATLRLLWESNALISSIVTYYPTDSPERSLDSVNLALKKKHEVILKNLNDNVDYTLLIKGKDSVGNETKPIIQQLKTANDLRPPEISNMSVESTIVGVGEEAKAQIIITWDTDEPATTQIEYAQGTGTTYGQTTQEDSSLTNNHSVTIPGLSPAKIYHLRAISKDKANNSGTSFDTVIVTPKSTKDALNLVIDNLSKTFGFLKGTTLK